MTMRIESFTGPYRFLSNFWMVPGGIFYEGLCYPHIEGAYQAAKTVIQAERLEIQGMRKATEAKAAGRKVTLREDWDAVKLQIMESILRRKFEQGSELTTLLLATGDAELIEGNHWNDTFWGVCRGKGENHLGKLLMKIREELKCESSSLE